MGVTKIEDGAIADIGGANFEG